jgi:hypothetical protein
MTTDQSFTSMLSSGPTARTLNINVSTLHDLRRKSALNAVLTPLGWLFDAREVEAFAKTYRKREQPAVQQASRQ